MNIFQKLALSTALLTVLSTAAQPTAAPEGALGIMNLYTERSFEGVCSISKEVTTAITRSITDPAYQRSVYKDEYIKELLVADLKRRYSQVPEQYKATEYSKLLMELQKPTDSESLSQLVARLTAAVDAYKAGRDR